jgi:hypothetical protein
MPVSYADRLSIYEINFKNPFYKYRFPLPPGTFGNAHFISSGTIAVFFAKHSLDRRFLLVLWFFEKDGWLHNRPGII